MAYAWKLVSDPAGDPRFDDYGAAAIASRIDPNLHHGLLTGFADYDPPGGKRTWFSLLLELKHVTATEFARGEWKPGLDPDTEKPIEVPADWRDWVKVPAWYADPPAGLSETYWCTARVTDRFFRELQSAKSALAGCVLRFGFGWSPDRGDLDCDGVPAAGPSPARRVWKTGDPVTVGVIDDGIAFAHRRFRHADGRSRVEHFWDQRETQGDLPLKKPGVPDAPVPFGAELVATGPGGLDELLAAASTAARTPLDPIVRGLLDEDRLYRDAGQTEVGRRARHGTHVMDIACGAEPGDPTAPRILAVQLPRPVSLDTTGHLLAPHLMEGLRFILDRADRIGGAVRVDRPVDVEAGEPRVPVVVNLSYGTIAGPQDGTSLLEQAMDELIQKRNAAGHPFAIVLGAGNHNLARAHATLELANGEEAVLDWRVPPDNPGSTFMEIWLPIPTIGVVLPQIELWLDGPTDAVTAPQWVKRGLAWQCAETDPRPGQSIGEDVVATVDYRMAGMHINPEKMSFWCDRDMVLLTVGPTRRTGGTRSVAPAGTWRVRVRNVGRPCTIDAWIQRNDAPFGFARRVGAPSRFDDPSYRVYDGIGRPIDADPEPPAGPVRRRSTLNALASGRLPLVVGAARRDAARLPMDASPYATTGPAFTLQANGAPSRWGPDAGGVADDGAAHHGVIGAGTRSAGAIALDGSSVAAPCATRAIAEAMSTGWLPDRQALGGMQDVHLAKNDTLQRLGGGVYESRRSGRVERLGRFRPEK